MSGLAVIVGVVGMAGHTLPALGLAAELGARGHRVRVHTWERWRAEVEGLGLEFAGGARQLTAGVSDPDAPVGTVARSLAESIDEVGADVVVSDGLTLSPALAAELREVPRVTLFPEVYPAAASGMPPFSLGAVAPRTRLGASLWRAVSPLATTRLPSTAWIPASRAALERERRALGLAPLADREPFAGGLTLVATLPQLEYPRDWPPGVHVVGPLGLDPRYPQIELPQGDEPLVLVAPSTVKDPGGSLVRTALRALREEDLRVVVSTSGGSPPDLPKSERVVVAEWIDYAQLMPAAALVICHGNHGTVVRALSEGVPVVVSPAMPDDAEHGARVAWAGAGAMVPSRLLGERSLRATVRRVLGDDDFAAAAGRIAAWRAAHDPALAAADLVEAHAADAG